MVNIDSIETLEISGYTMKSGIFVLNLISPDFGARTIVVDSDCELSDILKIMAECIVKDDFFINIPKMELMCRPQDAEILWR